MATFDAERWLAGLDPIGWRFGLERITALLSALGDPQHRFDSIHVVGTNGKSSVTVLTAALLQAAGRTAGCFLSPHFERWSERVRVGGAEVPADVFGAAAGRVADAVAGVEAALSGDERITQFEAATATAFLALAEAGVDVGVIEAGLGGRLDATNVLRSRATVLTSVGLDHTAWLGETEEEIAAEKLAVLREGTTLVVGGVSAAVLDLCRKTAGAREARLVEAPSDGTPFGERAPYVRRNLAVAIEAAALVAPRPGPDSLGAALRSVELGGRFEVLPGEPALVLDAAHNPAGAAALAEALRDRFPGSPVVVCLAVLSDKDAAGIVAELAPAVSEAVCTEVPPAFLEGAGRPASTSTPAAELARLWADAGVDAVAKADPASAVELARRLARERDGVALLTGSHYLLRWT